MRSDRLIFLIGVFILAWFIAGCGTIDGPGGTPNGTPENPPVGVVDNNAGFYVRYFENADYTYYDHAGDTTITAPCTAALGELVTCYIEGPELDLYHHGVQLQYNVPADMCHYLRTDMYHYYKFQPGVGPGTQTVSTDSLGQVGIDADDDGLIDAAAGCQFDYSSRTPPGPNCCIGTVDRTTRAWDPLIPGYGPSTTSQDVSWGGKVANCLAGPAMDTHPKDEEGFPDPIDAFVDGIGINTLYTVANPSSKGLLSNIFIANYFPGVVPTAVSTPIALLLLGFDQVQPYYDFKCLDRGEEILAEIRVMIRDWDTASAFNNILADPTNFNIPGNEPAPWNSFPFNDRADWEDFGVTFPELAE